ncbi:MAG TPA: alpha/beta hydrolase [Candidatus Dormibacteraeota bacterium]|jgi:pimeloyl-ACP methyl ester carboxylesterase|nr:alpha/beta hydrolase [Candidatus Dormibacteraeota bacterium]
MPEFTSQGLRLRYEVAGPWEAPPIVLVHGFASDFETNWVGSRWRTTLEDAGFLVIGMDCRGHGQSDKPHDVDAYARPVMAADVANLLDYLDVRRADYLGYSMGSRIGFELAMHAPERLGRMVLGGVGYRGADHSFDPELVARRLRGDESLGDEHGFYRFATSRPYNDLEALACCIVGQETPLPEVPLEEIENQVLLVIGDRDELAGDAPMLVERLPHARLVTLQGRNHMSAVPARPFKEAALAFLAED